MDSSNTVRNRNSLILCVVFLAGCSSATPTKVLESHGDSVRNMIAEQTYEPGDEAEGLDGKKAVTILQTYQGDVTNPKKVEKPVIQVTLD